MGDRRMAPQYDIPVGRQRLRLGSSQGSRIAQTCTNEFGPTIWQICHFRMIFHPITSKYLVGAFFQMVATDLLCFKHEVAIGHVRKQSGDTVLRKKTFKRGRDLYTV